MASKTRVTRNYRVTIPKEVRKKMSIEIGDELKVTGKGKRIVLQKTSKTIDLLTLAGCWKGYPEYPEEFMKNVRKLWST